MIETNQYLNSIIDINSNLYQVWLSYKLDDLEDEHIDEINLIIRKDLQKLDPSKDLTIELLTEFPITIWFYIISISKYVNSNLTIKTIENIDPIITLIDIPNNLIIMNI